MMNCLSKQKQTKLKHEMKTLQALKASMKSERKETKEWYGLIVEMYADLSPDLMQKAIDYLQEYRNHYEKQLRMIDKTLSKLISKKENSGMN